MSLSKDFDAKQQKIVSWVLRRIQSDLAESKNSAHRALVLLQGETASKQHYSLLHQSGFIILVRESSFQLLRPQCAMINPASFRTREGSFRIFFRNNKCGHSLGGSHKIWGKIWWFFWNHVFGGVVLLGIYVSKNGRFWF